MEDKTNLTTKTNNTQKSSFKIEKCNGIKVMYTNADMLHNKLNEIEQIALSENLDIIAITETLLKKMPLDSKPEDFIFKIKGYITINNHNGRGLCLFIKEHINFEQVLVYDYFKPSILIKIKNSQCNFTLGVFYRSPNASNEDDNLLIKLLNDISSKNMSLNNKLIIMGDFNLPGIDWNLERSKHLNDENIENKFLSCIQNNFLIQIVDQFTHFRGDQNPTLIDLVLTNDPELISELTYNAPVGKSHHVVISYEVYINPSNALNDDNNIKPCIKYNYDKGDYFEMRKYIKDCDWKLLFDDKSDVNTWNNNLEKVITEARDKFIPKITTNTNKIKRTKKSIPVDNTLLDKIKNKRKAFKYFKKYPTLNNKITYHNHRNICNSAIKNAKFLKELNIASKIKSNPKSFYNYFNAQVKPKEKISNLKKADGTLTVNDQEKAEVLNSFFSSVFVNESNDPVPDFSTKSSSTINNIIITEENMLSVLKKLNISKSPGPDKIHPRILRELCHELAHPFYLLFNKTLQDGTIPDAWKVAEVKPIFKKGNIELPGNYRPVSLTALICKIFEQFIRDALYNHLIDNSLLSKEQYGFCKKRSCASQLLVTLHEWLTYLDNKIPIDAAYLDFRKAFDSVPHKRLLHKLSEYGIKGNLLNWISSFLTCRTQYVNVNNFVSNTAPVLSGVPQGSVLGPCLFIYFINDLPEVIECLIKIFADDTKAYTPIFSNKDNELLQNSINKLVDWTDKWLLRFNIDKCKILHLGKNNPKVKYYITHGGIKTELEETTNEKDLGVFIDPYLSFDIHISSTIKKARKVSGMIIRTIKNKYPIIMSTLFKSLVRPILEYAHAVWCPFKKKHILEIEKVQRQFTKQIKGLRNLSYQERLSQIKLPSLEFRRLRGDYIEVYKIIHQLYDPVTTDKLLTLDSNKNTRSNTLKLKKKRVNLLPFQKFFTNRVINKWNKLPENIVCSESLNIFKNRLDTRLKDLMYQTNLEFLN